MDPVYKAGLVFLGLGLAFVLVNKIRTHAWYERRLRERTPILHEQLVAQFHPRISDPKAAVLVYDAGYAVHHLKPLSIGGKDIPQNMRLVTGADHKLIHRYDRRWVKN